MISFDRDKLGLVAATFFSTVVMAISFYRQAGGVEVATRFGYTFIGTYAAVFLLVLTFQRIAVAAIPAQRQREVATEAAGEPLPAEPGAEETEERA